MENLILELPHLKDKRADTFIHQLLVECQFSVASEVRRSMPHSDESQETVAADGVCHCPL